MLDEIVDYVKFLRLQVKVNSHNHPSGVRLEFYLFICFFFQVFYLFYFTIVTPKLHLILEESDGI